MTKAGCGTRFKKFWREGHQQARVDIRNRWHRAVVALWFIGLCACFGILYPYSQLGARDGSACVPDGSFSLYPEQFRYWSKSGFFQITLGFGSLNFEQAKVIDVIWDIGFGRGGQASLAFISWAVFSKYLTTSMETAPVTFHTYRTIFLKDQPPIFAIPTMIRDFTYRLGLHSKFAMTFMVITMIFVWAFPTLGSAMTGYDSNVKAFINDTGNFIPLDKFAAQLFTIHDGNRINKTSSYPVIYSDPFGDDPVAGKISIYASYQSQGLASACDAHGYNYRYTGTVFRSLGSAAAETEKEQCAMIANVLDYVKRYYVDKHDNVTSTRFANQTLALPRLNITTYYLSDLMTPGWSGAFNDVSRTNWYAANKTFTEGDIKEHGRCQTLSTYRWGFSFIQVNLMVIFLLVWTIGISIMWIAADIKMGKRGRHHVAGENKAVIELANAMRSQLVNADAGDSKEIHTLTETMAANRIAKDLQGGAIAYEAPLSPNGEDGLGDARWGIRSFLWKEKYWLFFILSFSVASITMGIIGGLPVLIFLVGFALQCIVVVSVGTTGRSRAILWWWLLWAFVIIPQLIAVIGLLYGSRAQRLAYY